MASIGPLPVYGRRLLPHVLDWYAQSDPNRIYASCGILENNQLCFKNYTVSDLAKATNECAWWMKENIGKVKNFETIAFIGAADLRYTIFCIAGIKFGVTALLLGPRNTAKQNQSMLRRTGCTKLVYTKELASASQDLRYLQPELFVTELESLDYFLSSKSDRHFLYSKSFVEAEDDPVLQLHSSGSTGDPKITTMTNGTLAVTDNDRNMPTPEGRQAQNASQFNAEHGCRFYTCFPPYHLAGLQAYLMLPMFYSKTTLVLGPSEIPPTGELVVDIIRQQKDMAAFYVPTSIIQQWAGIEEGMNQAKQLDFILYGGGALPLKIGERLSQYTNVRQMYGSVEVGQVQTLIPQKNEWSYIEWNPYEEVDMQPSRDSDDGICEVVLHQRPKFRQFRALSHNFPDATEWHMGDLFVAHPTKPGLWKYYSREDDLIVLSSGHKINPADVESQLCENPRVSGAVVIGTGRPQPAILLELLIRDTTEGGDNFSNIWTILEYVNKSLPEYARLSRGKVIFTDQTNPFPRTPKGSIKRKDVMAIYDEKIQSLYKDQTYQVLLRGTSSDEIKDFVRETLDEVLEQKPIHDNQSIFELGLDSVKVFDVLNILQDGIKKKKNIDTSIFVPKLIYQNSTICDLSAKLQSVINGNYTSKEAYPTNQREMNILIDSYINSLTMPRSTSSSYTVLLTGSTGSLGFELLNDFICDTGISKVYCFLRKERKKIISSSKVVDIIVDFSQEQFGLSVGSYNNLLSEVNVAVLLGWKVDFNLELRDFEPDCILPIRSFIQFSLESKLRPRIIFASSTGYAIHDALLSGSPNVEEEILSRREIGRIPGYSKSKAVGEHILAFASTQLNVPVSIIRIGQIAENDTINDSSWPEQEWLPSLVRTSKFLRLIPDMKLPVDWIPVNKVSQVLKDLINASQRIHQFPLLEIYNIVHPHPTSWSKLAQAIQQLSPGSRIVPLQVWIDSIKSHYENGRSVIKDIPAIKTLDFFEYLSFLQSEYGPKCQMTVSVSRAMSRSKIFTELRPIDDESLKKWASI